MKTPTKIALVIAAVVATVTALLFGAGVGSEGMMHAGMMGPDGAAGFGWMWVPVLVIVFFAAELVSYLFGKK